MRIMSLRYFYIILLAVLAFIAALIFVGVYTDKVEPIFLATEERAVQDEARYMRGAFANRHRHMQLRLRSMAKWGFEREYLALEGEAKREWEMRRFGAAPPVGEAFDLIFFMDPSGVVKYAKLLNPDTGIHDYAPETLIRHIRAALPELFANLEADLAGYLILNDQPALVAAAPAWDNIDKGFLGRVVGVEFLELRRLNRIMQPIRGELSIILARNDPRVIQWSTGLTEGQTRTFFDNDREHSITFIPKEIDGDRGFAVLLKGYRDIFAVSKSLFRYLVLIGIGFLAVFILFVVVFLEWTVEWPSRKLRLAAARAGGMTEKRELIPEQALSPFKELGQAVNNLVIDLGVADARKKRQAAELEKRASRLALLENIVEIATGAERNQLAEALTVVSDTPAVDVVFFYALTDDNRMRSVGVYKRRPSRATSRFDIWGDAVEWVEILVSDSEYRFMMIDEVIDEGYEVVAGLMREYGIQKVLLLPLLSEKDKTRGLMLYGASAESDYVPDEESVRVLTLAGNLMLGMIGREKSKDNNTARSSRMPKP